MSKARKLTIGKYIFIIGFFLLIAGILIGVTYFDLDAIKDEFAKLGTGEKIDFEGILVDFKGSLDGAITFVEKMKVASPVLLPIIFVGFALVLVLKDELAKKIRLPKSISFAIIAIVLTHLVMFIGKYVLVSMYGYLFVTVIVILYFDPAIKKAEEEANNG